MSRNDQGASPNPTIAFLGTIGFAVLMMTAGMHVVPAGSLPGGGVAR